MTVPGKLPDYQSAYIITHNPKTHLKRTVIPVPKPKPDQVLIKIAAAGMCHSDIHILEGSNPSKEEFVLGHEISGHIVQIGELVNPKEYPIGKLVAVHGGNACTTCYNCRAGDDHQCLKREWFGIGLDGGYEEYVAIPKRSIIPVPDGVSPEIAAVTTDAVLTPYHAIKKAGIDSMTRVLIIGVGGLGINALQICKHIGAHVTAMDLKQSARDRARKCGADVVLDNLKTPPARPFDVVLDVVGAKETFKAAQFMVRAMGKVVPIGLAARRLEMVLHLTATREIQIVSSFSGTSTELMECFELVAQGKVTPQIVQGDFDNVEHYLEQLHQGKIESRIVIRPPPPLDNAHL